MAVNPKIEGDAPGHYTAVLNERGGFDVVDEDYVPERARRAPFDAQEFGRQLDEQRQRMEVLEDTERKQKLNKIMAPPTAANLVPINQPTIERIEQTQGEKSGFGIDRMADLIEALTRRGQMVRVSREGLEVYDPHVETKGSALIAPAPQIIYVPSAQPVREIVREVVVREPECVHYHVEQPEPPQIVGLSYKVKGPLGIFAKQTRESRTVR